MLGTILGDGETGMNRTRSLTSRNSQARQGDRLVNSGVSCYASAQVVWIQGEQCLNWPGE